MHQLILLAVSFPMLLAAPWLELQPAQPAQNKSMLTFSLEKPIEKLWEEFKAMHNKHYETTEEEFRKDVFSTNVKKIQMHNYLYQKGKKSYSMDLNQFGDMEHHEFVGYMNGLKLTLNRTRQGSAYLSPNYMTVPDSVDWRQKGYVTPVKNQGQCGSCWAFSTTGSLEGQNFKKTGKLVSLSEQQLVDCSEKFGNNGCNGGLMDNAFKYIKANKGLDTEDSYPYLGKDAQCHFNPQAVGATDTGFTDIEQGSESQLQEAVAANGPVSVAIDASHETFQFYKTGVYDEPECSSSQLDHGVLVVGYGKSAEGVAFWIVKNSWGPTWGDEGYIMMSRNKDNQCGIASSASFPLV
jgi:cathepsin L